MAVDNAIYDRYADTWWAEDGMLHALRITLNPARFGYFRRTLEQRLAVPLRGATVLDVGCGGGFLAEEFARLGCAVVGVDPSRGSLDAARRHADRDGLAIEYREGSGEALPVDSTSFDVVCCCDVLEHVDDVDAVLAEIARVLRPGGVFVYDTINRTLASKLLVIKLMQEWRWSSFVPPDLHDWRRFLRPAELEERMRRAGLAPRGRTGLAPAAGPLGTIRAVRARKQGRIGYAEFGRRTRLREGRSTAVSYMGYAVRVPSAQRVPPDAAPPSRRTTRQVEWTATDPR